MSHFREEQKVNVGSVWLCVSDHCLPCWLLICTSGGVLEAPLLMPLPANTPEKVTEDDGSAWKPVTHVGDPDELLASA